MAWGGAPRCAAPEEGGHGHGEAGEGSPRCARELGAPFIGLGGGDGREDKHGEVAGELFGV